MAKINLISLALVAASFGLAFQNCGIARFDSVNKSNTQSAEYNVIGETNKYTKIDFINQIPYPINIDLEQGSLSVLTKTCPLDLTRLTQIKELFSDGKICMKVPRVPTPEICSISALPQVEVVLSGTIGRLETSGEWCNGGVFLCDGDQLALRAILLSIVENPPEECLPAK